MGFNNKEDITEWAMVQINKYGIRHPDTFTENEIAYAKSCLQPQDTGHISTAISWMTKRVNTIKEEIRQDANLHLKRY